ncbi:hypothetical protein ACVRUG_000998 [Cronobacter malonaticus]
MARISVTISPEMDELIDRVSRTHRISKASAVRRAFALLQISEEQMEKGRELGIIKEEGDELKAVGKIIGLNRVG